MTGAFSGGKGVPWKDIPRNQRDYMYAEVSSVETSAAGTYTMLSAPGEGRSHVIWGVSLDNSDNSSYLAGMFYKDTTSGDVIAPCSASNIGTGYIEFPLPSFVGDNLPVVFEALTSSGIADTSFATVYYTTVDV